MSGVLVLDSSACARPRSVGEIARALAAGIELAVVDVVFHRELRQRLGARLVRRGLRVESMPDIGPAIALRREHRCLSLADAFTLALAEMHGWVLLTDDASLAELAVAHSIAVKSPGWRSVPPARSPARVSELRGEYGFVI